MYLKYDRSGKLITFSFFGRQQHQQRQADLLKGKYCMSVPPQFPILNKAVSNVELKYFLMAKFEYEIVYSF